MRHIRVLAIVATFGFLPLVQAQTTKQRETAEQQVRDLMDQLVVAELAQNTDFFKHFFSDDFVIGTTLGDVLNKTQALERLGSPEHKVNEFHIDDACARLWKRSRHDRSRDNKRRR